MRFSSFAVMRWKMVRLEGTLTSFNAKMARWKKIIIQFLEEEVDESTPQQGPAQNQWSS